MAKDCIDIIKGFFDDINKDLGSAELKQYEAMFNADQRFANSRGLTMESVIPDDLRADTDVQSTTFLDRFRQKVINKYIEDHQNKVFLDLNDQLILTQRLNDIKMNAQWLEENFSNLEGDAKKGIRVLKAYNSLAFTTTKTFGHQTVESSVDSATKSITGGVITDLQKRLPGVDDVTDLYMQPGKKQAFFEEFYNLIQAKKYDPNAVGITKDKQALAMAKNYVEQIMLRTYEDLNASGLDINPFDARPKVVWKLYKMKNKNQGIKSYGRETPRDKKDFINFVADRLSDKHGTPEAKTALAQTIYDRFVGANIHDWRVTDEIVRSMRKDRIELLQNEKDRKLTQDELNEIPSTIEYRDGKAFLEVNEEFGGEISLGEILHRGINESGRQIGLVKMLGPNYQKVWDKITEYVKTGKVEGEQYKAINDNFTNDIFTDQFRDGGFIDRKIAQAADDYVDHLMHPYKAEQGNTTWMGTLLSSIRNLEIVKLGTAIISNFGDLASFLATGWGKVGANTGTMWRATMRLDTNSQRMTKAQLKEERALRALTLDFQETFVGTMQDRLRMMDYSGTVADTRMGDALVKGSAKIGHYTMKLTGFNLWNRSMAGGAAGTIYRVIGDMVKSKTAWNKLTDDQRLMYGTFGFTEQEYNILLKSKNIVDDNGRLNLYRFKTQKRPNGDGIATDFKTMKEMEGKLISMINHMSEGMIVKPSALDRAIIGFFAKPGSSMEQWFKAIMQFKTFMVSFSRKIIMNDMYKAAYGKNGQRVNATKNLALLYSIMLPLSYSIVQLKQDVAGKERYEPEVAAVKALQYTNILPFIGDLYWEAGGESLWDSSFGEGESRPPTAGQFFERLMGPVLNDFVRMTTGTVGLIGNTIETARDIPGAEDRFNANVSSLSKTLRGLDPFANVWQTKAIWRATVWDNWLEWIDPKGYKRTQKRMEKRARKERQGGNLYNVYGSYLNE
jgi:hypothetical protein